MLYYNSTILYYNLLWNSGQLTDKLELIFGRKQGQNLGWHHLDSKTSSEYKCEYVIKDENVS